VSKDNKDRFNQFVHAVSKFEGWKLKKLQSVWMRVLRNNLIFVKKSLRKSIRCQIVYFYLQVVEHFHGSYSQKIFHTSRSEELDAQLAFQAYHTYFKFSHEEIAKKQRNLLQENGSDNILYPTYFTLLPSLFKTIAS
jgi:predicted metal-dependent phosphoesterase TrpH